MEKVLKDEYSLLVTDVALENNFIDVMPVYFRRLNPALVLQRPWNAFYKRCFDIFFSALLILLLLTWLIPLLAIIISIDSPGPVFFFQRRRKKDGYFTCIKFRSMVVNDEADTTSAVENDRRITGVGKFLRSRHIDELPQLINVFLGDMSLVGPRPYMLSDDRMFEKRVRSYSARNAVKPGMTGLAQSLGNFGEATDINRVVERTALDIEYIETWSPGLDCRILLRTCRFVLHL